MYVAIAGNIGVGKSTLTEILARHYALSPVYEAVDENPYLKDFYTDMKRYAFHSQMFFLAKRLEQHLGQVNPGNRVIQDRTIYEDAAIFAHNLHNEGVMDTRDYRSYEQMYTAITQALRPPDLLIYLQASVPTLQARISQRGRDYETRINPDYLSKLNALYDDWIDDYHLSPYIIIPTDHTDFLHNQSHRNALYKQLESAGLSAPVLR